MSSNNYILINEIGENDFLIQERDADDGSLIEDIGKKDNLRDACKLAQSARFEIMAEYGISFRFID